MADLVLDAIWLPEFLREGGVVMGVILVCSVFALGVALERAVALRKNAVFPRTLVRAVAKARTGEELDALASDRNRLLASPAGRVVASILDNRGLPRAVNEEAMAVAGREAAASMQRGLGWIEVVAVTAPLLGLLGTVLGMVQVFGSFPMDAGELPAGIRKALYTTVAGLSVGIPMLAVLIGYSRRVERMSVKMESMAIDLLNRVYASENPPLRPAAGREEGKA